MSTVEDAFRRTVDVAFHQAVAFGTRSVVGTVASLPLVTAGPVVLGVGHAVRTLYRRGSQHGVRETAGLFLTGMRRHAAEGLFLSFALFLFAAVTAVDVVLLLRAIGPVGDALVVASLLMTVTLGLVAMHAAALVVCEIPTRAAVRDGAVLLARAPAATVLQGLVVASLVLLGTLTMVGWVLIGFAAAVAVSLAATDRLYADESDESPLYGPSEAAGRRGP
jgi:hypothetical protein